MNKNIILSFILLFIVGSACELDDLQQDPNLLAPEAASADFLLNSVEFGMKDWFWEVTDQTMEVTRMIAAEPAGNLYFSYVQPTSHDDQWELLYTNILTDANQLISISEEEQLFTHMGIAKVIQAYTLMVAVDFFGDIPFSEALDAQILQPTPDPGSEVYAQAEDLLDQAIAHFGQDAARGPALDLFYNGDTDQWIALANTLKLRMYLTTRLVDGEAAAKINALIAENNFITGSDHWAFPHGTQAAAPDSRHEYFIDNYIVGATDYQSNYYMWLLASEKGIVDPRTRYYFYRQTLRNTTDDNEQECISQPRPAHYPEGMPFCNDFLGRGYWGRDHLDTDGIPPDNLLRTVFGAYPAGGKFDANQGVNVTANDGLAGAGIHPFMMTPFVDFMLAESALVLGTTGDARALLEQGVRSSIRTVINFGEAAVTNPAFVPTPGAIEEYVSIVMDRYDTSDDKLGVVMTEYYLALFGNGIESYNLYRRTGKPENIQLALEPTPGPFIRSFFYPAKAANQNQNITQKGEGNVLDTRVFWDDGSAELR
ncbi:MAG: SusD/RagB family nutrient-binding outer membrane lipoprotein [Tunicatimonas sp.]|uniref:SusD/RagB family nutrient-binding outer membrane lipoprotein n=1 Tax=Tunicatimonas sp. TaxID=1940096 RepID=UPI003C7090DB